jgi:hypothetical protein
MKVLQKTSNYILESDEESPDTLDEENFLKDDENQSLFDIDNQMKRK